jgi:multiple sugar transport system ATP-binding protein
MSRIELKKVNKFYDKVHILKDVDLVIEQGDFMTLLGPSGCGKTTTLRVISGLENPQSGEVIIDGERVADPHTGKFAPPSKRNLNLVFQSYALWPHMTVFQNVAFGLTIQKLPKHEISEKVMSALDRMQIREYAQRYPSELSGGQQQRVAIARAIVSQPKILLLDEPLSNLDAKLRVDMRAELKRLHKELKTTIIYVTHDQVEALTLSSKIAVYFDGILTQCNTPYEIYNNPSTLKVAEFIGNPKINFLPGTVKALTDSSMIIESEFGVLEFDKLGERSNGMLKRISQAADCCNVTMAIRPEDIIVSREERTGYFACRISSILPAGSETLMELELGSHLLMAKEIGLQQYEVDDHVWIFLKQNRMNVYENNEATLIVRAM